MAPAPALRLFDLQVRDGGPDPLGRGDHRPGVGVEEPGVAVAGRAGGSGPVAFVQQVAGDCAHVGSRKVVPGEVGAPRAKSTGDQPCGEPGFSMPIRCSESAWRWLWRCRRRTSTIEPLTKSPKNTMIV